MKKVSITFGILLESTWLRGHYRFSLIKISPVFQNGLHRANIVAMLNQFIHRKIYEVHHCPAFSPASPQPSCSNPIHLGMEVLELQPSPVPSSNQRGKKPSWYFILMDECSLCRVPCLSECIKSLSPPGLFEATHFNGIQLEFKTEFLLSMCI